MDSNYYDEKLNSQKLWEVYNTNIDRIKQYLAAEIEFVRQNLKKSENVLELGAGYGRIVKELAPYCQTIDGIDVSDESVAFSKAYLSSSPNAAIYKMDIHRMEISETYDVVLCLQNGLSAMRLSKEEIAGIFELVKSGGRVYFSTYSARFWNTRLEWFEEQASKNLLGKIDTNKTKDGVIICEDGFRATTQSEEDFEEIGDFLGYPYEIKEVDESSLFLIIHKVS